MKRAIIFVTLPLILFVFIWTAQAQGGYDLSWFTMDGGGGQSSNGSYTLAGTAGQPDVGAALTGGGYTLAGGFWGVGGAAGGSDVYHIYLPYILRE